MTRHSCRRSFAFNSVFDLKLKKAGSNLLDVADYTVTKASLYGFNASGESQKLCTAVTAECFCWQIRLLEANVPTWLANTFEQSTKLSSRNFGSHFPAKSLRKRCELANLFRKLRYWWTICFTRLGQ